MKSVKATVVIPTYNHGPTLLHSVESVLNQTEQDFEIFIVGDGITDATRKIINQLLEKDSRICFFDNPKKSARTGEPYRNQALKSANGEIICYLSDDDLWLPNHLESMYQILQHADFAHSFPILLHGGSDGNHTYSLCIADLSTPFYYQLQKSGQSFIALSFVGHTKKLYEKLPFGWRETPKGIYTDFYMWKQFLDYPQCRIACSKEITSLKVVSPEMQGITIDDSATFLEKTYKFLYDKYKSQDLESWQFGIALDTVLSAHERLIQVENSLTWRARNIIIKIPFVAMVVRKCIKLLFRMNYK